MPPQHHARAAAAVRALQRWYNPANGLWESTGWWNSANALTALIHYLQHTGDRRYSRVIQTTYGTAQLVNAGFRNDYHDDNGWWALAWLAAFDLTGEPRYLDLARALFAAMTEGWDGKCGGGVWWSAARRYKNAIANELFLLTAARLHQRTNDRLYLDWALREWDWFAASGMINERGLVNDGLTADCRNNGRTAWTYNQGVILGGLVALHEITGDDGYLAKADLIATAALRDLTVPPGILAEPCEGSASGCGKDGPQFKGIFIRHLHELYQRGQRPEYRDFILANARSLWRNNRNRRNQLGLSWAGPFDRADAARQSSALDALNAAAAIAGAPARSHSVTWKLPFIRRRA